MIRATKGGYVLELQDDPKSPVLKVDAKANKDGTELTIDFSAKGGPKDVPGKVGSDTLTFPDGNVWQKL